jgi:uncharacterized protein (TIGR00369 family)
VAYGVTNQTSQQVPLAAASLVSSAVHPLLVQMPTESAPTAALILGPMDPQPPSPAFPLAVFIDMDVAPTGSGTATARVTAGDAHRNPHGAVHGAVLFTLVDTAMGAATMSLLDDQHWCASIDVQLRFFRPVFGGRLETTARVLHAGKRVVHLEADVRGDDAALVGKATAAFAVLPKPSS